MAERNYAELGIQLPYSVTGMALSMGGVLTHPVFQKIPVDLKYRLENLGFFDTYWITEQDLNELPDDVWEEIKTLITQS